MELEIYCPRCAWEPAPTSRWGCACGHSWNTFDTGGRCPRCQKQWHDTQCLSCAGWSPHLDWYHDTHGLVDTLLAETGVPATQP